MKYRIKLMIVIFVSILFVITINNISYRHNIDENNIIKKALHIRFPGYVTYYKPEHRINLTEGKLTILDSTLSREIRAYKAYFMLGICDSTYDTIRVNNQLIAISPSTSWEVWSWDNKYYRIYKWKDDE